MPFTLAPCPNGSDEDEGDDDDEEDEDEGDDEKDDDDENGLENDEDEEYDGDDEGDNVLALLLSLFGSLSSAFLFSNSRNSVVSPANPYPLSP
ncbi:hypothetical protein AGMMS49921_13800 [Endomicrobiia bacterium]|nr:hypothetical protein AGMMS49921_13800 [Endomicrobiia bacterium]